MRRLLLILLAIPMLMAAQCPQYGFEWEHRVTLYGDNEFVFDVGRFGDSLLQVDNLDELIIYGMDSIEVYHSSFGGVDLEALLEYQDEYGSNLFADTTFFWIDAMKDSVECMDYTMLVLVDNWHWCYQSVGLDWTDDSMFIFPMDTVEYVDEMDQPLDTSYNEDLYGASRTWLFLEENTGDTLYYGSERSGVDINRWEFPHGEHHAVSLTVTIEDSLGCLDTSYSVSNFFFPIDSSDTTCSATIQTYISSEEIGLNSSVIVGSEYLSDFDSVFHIYYEGVIDTIVDSYNDINFDLTPYNEYLQDSTFIVLTMTSFERNGCIATDTLELMWIFGTFNDSLVQDTITVDTVSIDTAVVDSVCEAYIQARIEDSMLIYDGEHFAWDTLLNHMDSAYYITYEGVLDTFLHASPYNYDEDTLDLGHYAWGFNDSVEFKIIMTTYNWYGCIGDDTIYVEWNGMADSLGDDSLIVIDTGLVDTGIIDTGFLDSTCTAHFFGYIDDNVWYLAADSMTIGDSLLVVDTVTFHFTNGGVIDTVIPGYAEAFDIWPYWELADSSTLTVMAEMQDTSGCIDSAFAFYTIYGSGEDTMPEDTTPVLDSNFTVRGFIIEENGARYAEPWGTYVYDAVTWDYTFTDWNGRYRFEREVGDSIDIHVDGPWGEFCNYMYGPVEHLDTIGDLSRVVDFGDTPDTIIYRAGSNNCKTVEVQFFYDFDQDGVFNGNDYYFSGVYTPFPGYGCLVSDWQGIFSMEVEKNRCYEFDPNGFRINSYHPCKLPLLVNLTTIDTNVICFDTTDFVQVGIHFNDIEVPESRIVSVWAYAATTEHTFRMGMDYKAYDHAGDTCTVSLRHNAGFVYDSIAAPQRWWPAYIDDTLLQWEYIPQDNYDGVCMPIFFTPNGNVSVGETVYFEGSIDCGIIDCEPRNNKQVMSKTLQTRGSRAAEDFDYSLKVLSQGGATDTLGDSVLVINYLLEMVNPFDDTLRKMNLQVDLPRVIDIRALSNPFSNLGVNTFVNEDDWFITFDVDSMMITPVSTNPTNSSFFVQFELRIDTAALGDSTIEVSGNLSVGQEQYAFEHNLALNVLMNTKAVEDRNAFEVYPNPSRGIFRATINKPGGVLNITSLDGKRLLSQQINQLQEQVDISFLPDGLYIATYRNGSDYYKQTLVKD